MESQDEVFSPIHPLLLEAHRTSTTLLLWGGWVTARVYSFFNEGEKQPVGGERIRKDFILWGVDQRLVRGK